MAVTETTSSTVAPTRDANLRELIITLYGLYARAQNNWLSIAALVRLMGDLGADEPSVRSSIYRLKQRGVLDAAKIASTAGYALSAASIQSFAEGDVRIFGRRRATLEDGWLLLIFSIPETQRDKRHELRTQLFRLNFGTAAPGTWIAPGNLYEETRVMLERHDLTNFVDIFRGDHLAFGDLRTKVQTWWEFDELTQAYGQFITRYQPILKRYTSGHHRDQDAFIEYMHMLTSWRRIPDPRLPPEVLPKGWNGLSGSDMFADLNDLLKEPARRHALEAVHRWAAG